MRKLRTNFGRNEAPSALYIRYLVKNVKETGILINKPKHEKPKALPASENIAAVAEGVREAPSTSIQCRSQQLNISQTSLSRILHLQFVQELKPLDHPMCFRFAKWACGRLIEDADFGKKNHLFR